MQVLRKDAEASLSLVAKFRGELVGHVMFSPVRIEGLSDGSADMPTCAGLAPLGVKPEVQGQGAGSALVRAGLRECVALGWQAVFLLGSPVYYSRFGFSLAAPRGLRYESEAFDAGFQLIELAPDVLSGCSGWVRYHEAFSEM